MAKTIFILYEHAHGYALFELIENEEIGMQVASVEKSVCDFKTFSTLVNFKAFSSFPTAEHSISNAISVSNGECPPFLANFLTEFLPSKGKRKKPKKLKFELWVNDIRLAGSIQKILGIPCSSNVIICEILRGIRMHFSRFLDGVTVKELITAQLGLSHHFSQNKVKFSLKCEDNMVMQSICTLDAVDKDLNTFYMRIREWYSWHFPELQSLIKDKRKLVETITILGRREKSLEKENVGKTTEKLTALLGEKTASKVLKTAERSIGFDTNAIDAGQITLLAERYLSLLEYRNSLFGYLSNKMSSCAPNLKAVIGDIIGARLINHAGGLLKLAKSAASTVQVLGAEKALFRAIKTRGKTPKYGLIFHSSFISRAGQKDKGKISRYLANKCAIASRIDSFSETPKDFYGKKLKEQVEERLEYFRSGKRPMRNVEAMHAAEMEAREFVQRLMMKRKRES